MLRTKHTYRADRLNTYRIYFHMQLLNSNLTYPLLRLSVLRSTLDSYILYSRMVIPIFPPLFSIYFRYLRINLVFYKILTYALYLQNENVLFRIFYYKD